MPYAIRNASLELLSPCSLSIACESFYVFWDIFESFRLQKIVLEITWMGIKSILLQTNAYNFVVWFTTIYIQVLNTTFIQGVAIHFPTALVCIAILLIQLFKS